MAKTIEEAYARYCQGMPKEAAEARRVADDGDVHELVISTQRTKKRGYVCEMRSRVVSDKQLVGKRLIDLR